jgi:hypothetical protein
MSERIRIEEVLRYLGVGDESWLEELRGDGLFATGELTPDEAEELRVAALLVRDLGVNAAGAEVILHMRRRMLCLESRVRVVLQRLLEDEERGG